MIGRTIPCCTVALVLSAASSAAQERLPIVAEYLYPVKFVCGGSSESFQEGLVRGVHATSISIHNPSNVRAVNFTKQVSRALPFQRSGSDSELVVDTLPPRASIDIECNEIRMMLPQSMTAQFRSGFLRIHATRDLDVVVVYSSRPHEADVSTIDVEVVHPQRVRGDVRIDLPDLTISDVDLDTLEVSCPTGPGSCTASVDVSVENIGAVESGPFDVLVTFDPEQRFTFEHSIPMGLAAGATTVFNASMLTGRNCFDPDCRICALADPDDLVEEVEEGNNELCREKQG